MKIDATKNRLSFSYFRRLSVTAPTLSWSYLQLRQSYRLLVFGADTSEAARQLSRNNVAGPHRQFIPLRVLLKSEWQAVEYRTIQLVA